VADDHDARMGRQLGLRADGVDDRRMRVADVEDREPGREVDQAVPIDVFDDRAFGCARENRCRVPDPARDCLPPAIEQGARRRAGYLRHELAGLFHRYRSDSTPAEESRCATYTGIALTATTMNATTFT